jgi:hypothetical protein
MALELNHCCDMRDCIEDYTRDLIHTTLIIFKDSLQTNQVDRHTQLCIGLNVQILFSGKPRRVSGTGVLPRREAGVGNVEELGW